MVLEMDAKLFACEGTYTLLPICNFHGHIYIKIWSIRIVDATLRHKIGFRYIVIRQFLYLFRRKNMDDCIVIHRIYTFHIYLQEHVIVCISVLVSNVFFKLQL